MGLLQKVQVMQLVFYSHGAKILLSKKFKIVEALKNKIVYFYRKINKVNFELTKRISVLVPEYEKSSIKITYFAAGEYGRIYSVEYNDFLTFSKNLYNFTKNLELSYSLEMKSTNQDTKKIIAKLNKKDGGITIDIYGDNFISYSDFIENNLLELNIRKLNYYLDKYSKNKL